MQVAVFSTKPYDQDTLSSINQEQDFNHDLHFFEARLMHRTIPLAQDYRAVCVFVNDVLDAEVIQGLAENGTELIALRCAGFNNVDIEAAHEAGLTVMRVPAYSPHAVAEHALSLMLALNRHVHRAYARVREGNFILDGLLGFDMAGRTIGVVGTGKIGVTLLQLLQGFECKLLAHDPYPNEESRALGATYVGLDELLSRSDIVSLHCPLTPETYHLINQDSLQEMKKGAMLINTSRGALVDAVAVIEALKSGQLGYLGLDVYEEEADLFFEDLSDRVIQDDVFARLLTFPNVIITGHQAFFTREALNRIAEVTLSNVSSFARGESTGTEVTLDYVKK